MTSPDYPTLLGGYYDEQRIGVERFDCRHKADCCRDASPRPLTFGAEAHVGSRYGGTPRVVVVALDIAGESPSMAARQAEVEAAGDGRNAHMRGTKETLKALLGEQPDGSSPWAFFAMINAAKCSAADGKADKVPNSLYRRCRPFAVQEIARLDPDVLILQGVEARSVVKPILPVPEADLHQALETFPHSNDAPVASWLRVLALTYLGVTRVTGVDVLVFHPPHPSDRNGRWQVFQRPGLSMSGWLIRRLLGVRRRPA